MSDARKIDKARAELVRGRKERIDQLCDRDLDDVWNSLKAIALCGFADKDKLAAIKLMLDYAIGPPTTTGIVQHEHTLRRGVDVRRLTPDEFAAAKVLHSAQERLDLEEQGILDEAPKGFVKPLSR